MISVCLASYNGVKYICEQLVSILSQLGANDEVIVSDDGSTDGTLEAVSAIADKRVRIVENVCGCGVVGNFENAIRSATGDYVFLSDQDDVWLPHKVELFMGEFRRGARLVLSNCYLTDTFLMRKVDFWDVRGGVYTDTLRSIVRCDWQGGCMAFERSCVSLFLPFPRNKYVLHDLWIGLTAGSCVKVGLIWQPTLLYRRHSETVTPSGLANTSLGVEHSRNSLAFKIIKRFVLLFLWVKWRVCRA